MVLFLYEASQKTAAAGSESTGKHYVTDEIDSSIIVPLTKTTNLLLLSHVFLFFLFRTLFRAAVLLFSLILLSPDIQRRTIVIGRPSVHASVITLTRHNKGHLLSPFFFHTASRDTSVHVYIPNVEHNVYFVFINNHSEHILYTVYCINI